MLLKMHGYLPILKYSLFPIMMTLIVILIGIAPAEASTGNMSSNQVLPDLSGIGWIEGDTFLAVHDAKYPSEADAPRVSKVSIPNQLGGTEMTPLNVTWPASENPASDLECVARIPNSNETAESISDC